MTRQPRPLTETEVAELLALDVPARLATLDKDGFPHVVPIWFVWDGHAFYMSSLPDRAHVKRLTRDPRASICVDVEDDERADGERPNRAVRAVGPAEVFVDEDGDWTHRITEKYVRGPGRDAMIERRTGQERWVIRLQPVRMFAVASV